MAIMHSHYVGHIGWNTADPVDHPTDAKAIKGMRAPSLERLQLLGMHT